MRYFAQFRAGLGELVNDALQQDLAKVKVVDSDGSSLIFDSGSGPAKVGDLGYLKNVFSVLGSVRRCAAGRAAEQFAEQILSTPMMRGQGRVTSFRTMVSVDGKLLGLPRQPRTLLESAIARSTGARLSLRGGGVEYWLIGRRGNEKMLFCRRLTRGVQPGVAGSLGKDLATLLVKASGPRPDDVFLDPFAGCGSIVRARIALPYRRATYSDLAAGKVPPELRRSSRVAVFTDDALELPSIPSGSVSSIVTDPPWGEYDKGLDFATFAQQMMASFDRALDPHRGRLVLLLSRRAAEVTHGLWASANLQLTRCHDLLVNGHPATAQVGGR